MLRERVILLSTDTVILKQNRISAAIAGLLDTRHALFTIHRTFWFIMMKIQNSSINYYYY